MIVDDSFAERWVRLDSCLPQFHQIVSGLVEYVPENEMLNALVLVICNLKGQFGFFSAYSTHVDSRTPALMSSLL